MSQRILAGPLLAGTLCLAAAAASAQQTTAPAPTPTTPAPAAAAAPAGQAAPAALPPGSPLIGRPANNEAAAKLAPVPAPPLAAAADKIPLDKLKAPKGFNLELYASGMPNARSLALSSKGTVFVGSRLQDKVYAITTDKDGKRQVHILVSGLYRPNGVAYKDGTLYIAELSQISKIEHVDDKLNASPKPTVIYSDLPKDEAHGWKFLAIGPDNKLYVEVGQPGNNALHDKDHGQIRRMNLDGSGAEVVAFGVRHSVGSTGIRRPKTSTSPTMAVIGSPKICPTTNSIASPRSGRTSASRIVTKAIFPTMISAGAGAAANLCRQSLCSVRMPRPWACASIPARCSRPNTATRFSSRATVRGIGPLNSAAISRLPSSTKTAA
jgi:hypothetical protein